MLIPSQRTILDGACFRLARDRCIQEGIIRVRHCADLGHWSHLRKRQRQIRLRPNHGQEPPCPQQHRPWMGCLGCCDGGYLVHWLRFRRGHSIYGRKYPIEG